MAFKFFIGVDTAKTKYDLAQLSGGGEVLDQREVLNANEDVGHWLEELLDGHHIEPAEVLLCVEQTGIYTHRITHLAYQRGVSVWLVDAYHLSRSVGRSNVKTDKADALKIATYAQRNYLDYNAFKPNALIIDQIKSLENQRKRISKATHLLAVPIKEEAQNMTTPLDQIIYQATKRAIRVLEETHQALSKQLDEIIEKDEEFAKKRKLATSVPGFGKVNFRNLVCMTHGFTRLDDPRKLCANIGIAPYPRQSGKCLNRKPRIPKMANSQFKTDLTCGVQSILKSKNRFGRYYRHKTQGENKLHLIAVNNLRNKMIHTVMACLRNEVMYDENYA